MKIVGNTVGMGLPKPNLKQTDPRKGDFVKGKDEIPVKVSQLENDSGYLTEHQDISGKLDANKLPEAVNDALAQAKASGEFDGQPGKDGADGKSGADGYTPVKGVDYFDGLPGKDGQPGKDGNHGKSAYQYAKEAGYTGTEAEFAEKLASGGGSGIHIGTEAPTDPNVNAWIDTDEEAPSGGGVSSWNDLTDKPFGTEQVIGTVLAETSPFFDEEAGQFIMLDPISVVPGERYTVNWNGTEYNCTCREYREGDGDEFVAQVLGRLKVLDDSAEDTGEPFVIITASKEIVAEIGCGVMIQPLDGSTELTISITGMTETVKKLDEKYIPDSIARVDDIPECKMKTVNGVSPNADGDVVIDFSETVNDALAQAKASGEFKGDPGEKGDKGDKGNQGEQGLPGKDGTKGDKGDKGDPGENGKDGTNGKDGADGKTPVKGTDYYTEADKTEMVNRVLSALPTWNGGSY